MILKQPLPQHARTIAISSATGGAGCTTIAVNLACGMKKLNPDRNTLLVDGQYPFGTVQQFLELSSPVSRVGFPLPVDYAAYETADLDRLLMTSTSGVKVLPAPPYPIADYATSLTKPDVIARRLQRDANPFDIIVVDVGTNLDRSTTAIVSQAYALVIVLNQTPASVNGTRLALEFFSAAGVTSERMHLVLNKATKGQGIVDLNTIPHLFKREITSLIPTADATLLDTALLRGQPIVEMPGDSEQSPQKELMALAADLYGRLRE